MDDFRPVEISYSQLLAKGPDEMKFGIYRLDGMLDQVNMESLESLFNRRIDIISFYRAWNRCRIEDDISWLTRLAKTHRQILLTWEPWMLPENSSHRHIQPDFSLSVILSGKYDGYIRCFARALKDFPHELYLRPMHEMNGNWYPWCGTVNGNSPEEYRKVWHHLRSLFAEEGATGINWVWSPYALSFPPGRENSLETYFPGDDQLDWVAIDGYNWGSVNPGTGWQRFEDIFSSAYESISKMSGRPLMIGETGSAENGGKKDVWISEAFEAIRNRFPKIETLVWFDVDKECDWRISSSPESLAVFRTIA
jgi:beta-mannanase